MTSSLLPHRGHGPLRAEVPHEAHSNRGFIVISASSTSPGRVTLRVVSVNRHLTGGDNRSDPISRDPVPPRAARRSPSHPDARSPSTAGSRAPGRRSIA